MLAIRKLLAVVLLISPLPALSQAIVADSLSKESQSQEAAFRSLLLNTIILEPYLAGYSFMWGTMAGGSAITQGGRPEKATALWAGVSLAGFALSWVVTQDLAKQYQAVLRSGPGSGKPGAWRFYRVLFAGASTASILNFEAESIFDGDNGRPQWTASTSEVKTATSFPALGHRLGASGRRWGGEFETSLVSHHTIKQTTFFDAEGEIYYPPLGAYVPAELGDVELPDRFLMLHSLSMGANFYFWLPKVGVSPYVGMGGRLLLNSVQSQYPGPANLSLEVGNLALDSITAGWGFHALFGFRTPLSNKKFLYAEFRPARHYFSYESGSGKLQEHDRFALQIFEFQLGLGFFFY